MASEASDKLGVWLAVFTGGTVMGLVVEAPLWIPEWQSSVDALAGLLLLLAAAASVGLVNIARRRISRRIASGWRWVAYVGLASLALVGWCIGALVAVFAVIGVPFGESYVRSVGFDKPRVTLYLYDASFLDPRTKIYVRRGKLPLRELVRYYGKKPDEVQVTADGNSVVMEGESLDLSKFE